MKQQTKQTKKSKISYKQLYVNEKKKRENTETKIEQYQKEIEILKKTLEEKDKEIKNHKKKNGGKNTVLEHTKLPKGSQCSVSGNNYEKEIYNICKKCDINNKPFNTQREEELGGNTIKNDIECNFIKEKDIGIEIKKSKTPDWMQCCIKYNNKQKKWEATEKGKIPIKCRELFNKLINNIDLYDGEVPPFMEKLITHEEWIKIKKETTKWDDKYITIPSDSISRLYQEKGCNYIQISDGYGLYHLGKDICNFDVPLFNIEQQIRIRTKIHTKQNKKGFCSLSVTIACQPKNIKKLIKSNYSLDNKDKLPSILIYKM
jgi:hypothetical protein